ncbi:MAG: hypothetical protein J6C82_01190 [Clostridia bacterium]|nr:hypothetical protein [Clostridia bacterium]
MNRKIWITAFAAAIAAVGAAAAFNSAILKEADIVTVYENDVTVSGKTDSKTGRITLAVVGPDITYKEYAASGDFNAVVHIDQGTITDGSFEFEYVMNTEPGVYEAAVLDDNGKVIYTDSFTYGISDRINDFTATYTAPWMANWHLTTEEQLESGIKGGEGGQMVWGIAIAPSDENKVLLGTDTSGIYKSDDAGSSWHAAGLGFYATGITDIEFYPDDANIAFAAASSHSTTWQSPFEGLWRSEDSGETWEQVLSCGFGGSRNESIVFADPENGIRTIYAGAYSEIEIDGTSCSGGVYQSDDLGKTWTNIGLTDMTINSLYYENGCLYAATNDYIYILNDGAWTKVSSGLVSNILSVAGFKDALYAVSSSYLYKSSDSGESWSCIKTKSEIGASGSFAFLMPFGDALGIMTNMTSNNFFYSTDGCETFRRPEFDKTNAFVQENSGYYSEGADAFKDGSIIIAMDGEVYKGTVSDSILKVTPSSSGFSAFRARHFLFDEENPDSVIISAVDKGMVATTGETVANSYLPVDYSPMEDYNGARYNGKKTVYSTARDPRNSQRILISIGSWSTSIIKESLDGGKTFAELEGSEGVQTEALMFNAKNPDIIYAGNRVSYDNGESWTSLDMKIKAVSPFDGDKVYALSSSEQIYVSDDAGKTWTLFVNDYVYGCQNIHADIAVEDKLWAGTFSGGIKIVTKEGVKDANNGITESAGDTLAIYDIAQNPKNPNHLAAGGVDGKTCSVSSGLFESFDGGASWRQVEGLTGSRDVWTVKFHPIYPRLYIGTSSGTFIYEYEKYSDEKLILEDTKGSMDSGFTGGFKIWSFIQDKLPAVAVTALYTNDGGLKAASYDCFTLYKNRPFVLNKNLFDGEILSDDTVKQFIWNDGQKPLTEPLEY